MITHKEIAVKRCEDDLVITFTPLNTVVVCGFYRPIHTQRGLN